MAQALSQYTTLPLYERILTTILTDVQQPSFKPSITFSSNLEQVSYAKLLKVPVLGMRLLGGYLLGKLPNYFSSRRLKLISSFFIYHSVLPGTNEATGSVRGVISGLWNGAKHNVKEIESS